jgi:23S rRNA A2030 N6-methylase RlmJ
MVVNPPWEFERELRRTLAWLEPALSRERHAPVRLEWLVAEK